MASGAAGLIQQIQIDDGGKHNFASTAYGICNTEANNANKVVEMTGFTLIEGTTVHIKFTHNNTVAKPTLNINGTGAKPIVQYGTTAAATSDSTTGWYAGAILALTYDGTSWVRDQGFNTNSTYTITSVWCNTAAATAAKTFSNAAYYTANDKSYFEITFRYANSAASALTLNGKTLYINGEPSSADNHTIPAGKYLVYYDNNIYYIRTDGKITGDITGDAATVNGLTVETAVPPNAKFTDTNKYHKSGSWNDLTYIATAVNGADELKFTIPDNYGDTKNPYASKTKSYVLAAPSNANGVPSFRALATDDIPNSILKWQTTTAESTALYDFGVYVNMNNANGSSMNGGNYFNILNMPYRKASGNKKADWGWQLGNTTSNDGRLWYRTAGDNVWGEWQTIAHATQSTSDVGSSSQPVYMTKTGVITSITAVGAAYGGTGKTTLKDSANALINALDTGSSPLTTNDYVITQYVSGGTTTTTYHRRPASQVVNETLVKAALGTVGTTAKKFLKDTGVWAQVAWGDLTGVPSSFAPSAHDHNRLNSIGRLTTADAIAYNPNASQGFKLVWNIYDSSSRTNDATNSPSFDAGVINIPWDWGGYNSQIAISNTVKDNTRMQIRSASHIDNGESANPRYTPNYGAWREVVTATKATKVGDTNKPVYINATGQATAISYTIEKSVPSNAVFTDHYAWGDITNKPTTLSGYGITDKVVKIYERSEIGISPNFDSPGVNGYFEIRNSSETTQESGLKPFNGYGSFLNLQTSVTRMQIAGAQNQWYIRGTQSGQIDTAMSTTQWNRIVLNSGSWDISITGSAAKLTIARNLGVALGSTAAVTFDGSANQTSIPVSGTLGITHGGTGQTTLTAARQQFSGPEFIIGTWTAASGTWTGTTTDSELYDGKQIILYMPFAGSGNATLNLTLADGTSTGAKNVYFESTTRFTTHKGQNAQLHLIYHKALKLSNGTTYEGWWYVANRDTDNDYRTRQNVLADTDTSNRSLLLSNPVVGTANNNTSYVTYRNDKIYANVNTGIITATGFNGDLTGNVTGDVTGNVSGSSGSCTGNAATATAIKTAGTTAQFYRGDNSWSNIIQQTTPSPLEIATNCKIGTAIKDLHFTVRSGSGTGINDGNAGGITIGTDSASYGGIYWQSSGSYGLRLHFATTSSFANGAYTRMLITHDGKVGIGTLTPDTLLTVNGNAKATKFIGALQGNADTATSSKALANYYTSRPANANITHVNNGGVVHFKATSTMTSNKPMGDGNILHFYWDTESAWNSQLYIPDSYSYSMQWRSSSAAGTWDSWRTLLDSSNYTDYTVTHTGTGASGSWGISITGTAAKATADASGNTITSTYATKTEIEGLLAAADAMIFKGVINAPTDLPNSHSAGDTYRVGAEGTYPIVDSNGRYCEEGTLIICIANGTDANPAHWTAVETNEDGAVIGPSSSKGNNIVTFSGNTGRIIQDSGKAFSTATPGSSSTDAQIPTAKAVWAAINALDANLNSTTPGAGKTLTAFSQTDGKVSATFGDISITKSQVSDFAHDHDAAYLKLNGSNNMTADVNIIAGDTDKFVNFWYNANKTAGASWRIGELGSGSSDAKYFVIQSGTSDSSKTAWNDTIQIGANTFNVYLPSTTASTSTTSGALKVAGGVGVAGQLTATRLAANGSNTAYNLYVNGTSYFKGNVTHDGIVYFKNDESYYINKNAQGYLDKLQAGNIRLTENKVEFYTANTDVSQTSNGNSLCGDISATAAANTSVPATMSFNIVQGASLVNSNFIFNGDIIPQSNATYNLGSISLHWKTAYINNTILVGAKTQSISSYSDSSELSYISPGLISVNINGTISQNGSGYYLINAGQQYARLYIQAIGKTDSLGQSVLELGNSVGSGTANNSYGTLHLYHTDTTSAKYTATGWTGSGISNFTILGATSTTQNIAAWSILTLGNNKNVTTTDPHSQGLIRIYSKGTVHTDIQSQVATSGSHTVYLPKYGNDMYLVHAGDNSAVGSGTQPVYVAENGRITACTTTVGDAYTPVYSNAGVLTATAPVQYNEFTIVSADTQVDLNNDAYTADTYVLTIVITSGEANINAPITWTSSTGKVRLQTSVAVSGDVSGYILTARGTSLVN